MRLVKAAVPDYVLRVELKYIKPAIWRRIIVPGSIRLGKLHVVLQLAMGWEGGHLHEFVFGQTNYGEPDDFGFPSDPPMLNEVRVTLAKALGGLKSFTYIYDYGDNWQHRIKVEKALVPDPDMRRPLCLAERVSTGRHRWSARICHLPRSDRRSEARRARPLP